jgi:DNA-binding CsgD family transcriptional regulator/PAS domain-containing protein
VSQSLEDSLREADTPYAILDLQTNRLAAANDAFANLLEIPPGTVEGTEVLGLLTPETRTVAECVTRAMAGGVLSSCQGTALVRLPSGRDVEVAAWVRSLPGGRALLAAARDGAHLPEAAPGGTAAHALPPVPDASRLVLGAVDHDWRFSEISPDATTWFGWNLEECRGTPLQSMVHPDDAPLLLLALGRAGVDRRGVATVVRVRSDATSTLEGSSEDSPGDSSGVSSGGCVACLRHPVWVPVRCEVSPLCNHNPARFAVAMRVLDTGHDVEPAEERAARLEDRLWRIALEIARAGIGDAPTSGEMWWGDPALRDLSRRQLEILHRLLRGERVPTIARDLFLSRSTVRNHLSAIYRRLGVHSQAELLARLLPRRRATA